MNTPCCKAIILPRQTVTCQFKYGVVPQAITPHALLSTGKGKTANVEIKWVFFLIDSGKTLYNNFIP